MCPTSQFRRWALRCLNMDCRDSSSPFSFGLPHPSSPTRTESKFRAIKGILSIASYSCLELISDYDVRREHGASCKSPKFVVCHLQRRGVRDALECRKPVRKTNDFTRASDDTAIDKLTRKAWVSYSLWSHLMRFSFPAWSWWVSRSRFTPWAPYVRSFQYFSGEIAVSLSRYPFRSVGLEFWRVGSPRTCISCCAVHLVAGRESFPP